MTPAHSRVPADRRGSALLMALLVSIAIAAMALGAIMLASSAQLSTALTAREASLNAAANGGLEIIRDSINRGAFDSLLPDSGYTVLANNATITDAFGSAVPGISRSLYVGRTGGKTGGPATAGQYGSNFASALSVVTDIRGNTAVRRLLMTQESWAKYALAINNWSGTASYGCDESFSGPVFSNANIVIVAGCTTPKTLFHGPVNVVGTIVNQGSGSFLAGVQSGVTPIQWPTAAAVSRMQSFAQAADAANGDYDLTSPDLTVGSTNPALRIEFVPVDVNGNGIIEWDEGFMRVWVANSNCSVGLSDSVCAYATARRWPTAPGGGTAASTDPNLISRNCGAQVDLGSGTHFYNASDIYNATAGGAAAQKTAAKNALTSPTRRCFLGGDPHLFTTVTGDTLTPDSTITNTPGFGFGWWKKRRSGPWPGLSTVRSGDRSYLIPLGANPNFKGVIFVQGDVAVSGSLRGRVTVVATGNIMLADDLLYNTVPGGECDDQGDIMGAIATRNALVEDDNLQTPFAVGDTVYGGFDDTNDANYNMFVFALGNGSSGLGNVAGEWVLPPFSLPISNLAFSNPKVSPSAVAQRQGLAANGSLRVTGGLAEGRIDGGTFFVSNYGWSEAYSYDACGAVNPPPYFPTTGRFIANRYYELDPVWLRQLTVAQYFRELQAQ
ncbi:MAG TPA: hypothetical protein VHW65_04685 [Gemmatimonadales bacterium]|nr:hypothetical protein [Gemmatimonadales bacterium]